MSVLGVPSRVWEICWYSPGSPPDTTWAKDATVVPFDAKTVMLQSASLNVPSEKVVTWAAASSVGAENNKSPKVRTSTIGNRILFVNLTLFDLATD